MAKPKKPTTSPANHPSARTNNSSSRPLAAWESAGTCEVCAKKISHGRYCKACAETQVPLEFCTSCGQFFRGKELKLVRGKELCKQCAQEKANVLKTLPKTIDDWSSLTPEQKIAFNESKEDHRLTPEARSQRRASGVATTIIFLASLAAGALLFNGIVNAPNTPSDISGQSSKPSIEQPTPTPVPTQTPPVLVAGTQDDLTTYLIDNFQGTDWFMWVEATSYYVDGSVRVMNIYLNAFVATDRDAAKQIAQTACIAVYQYWIDQERNGNRAFEVLFVGDDSGNVYRREDYAGGENCLSD